MVIIKSTLRSVDEAIVNLLKVPTKESAKETEERNIRMRACYSTGSEVQV
jgi:hypothetical protein